jgi:replicative DNA helicase
LSKFNDGSFTADEIKEIERFSAEFSKMPFMVCEDFALTLQTISKKCQEIAPDVLIVDYIQAMKYEDGGSHPEITNVMRGLHEIATKYNIPVIVASQLVRVSEGQEVNMSHLKGSGSIEELSDVIIALWPVDRNTNPMPVDMYILKSKYGETGRVTLMFDKKMSKFYERV